MAEWIKEQDPIICCLKDIHFSLKNIQQPEGEKMELSKTFQAMLTKKVGVNILVPDK